jgi:hypothetical protein
MAGMGSFVVSPPTAILAALGSFAPSCPPAEPDSRGDPIDMMHGTMSVVVDAHDETLPGSWASGPLIIAGMVGVNPGMTTDFVATMCLDVRRTLCRHASPRVRPPGDFSSTGLSKNAASRL